MFKKHELSSLAFLLVLAFFVIFALYFALNTSQGIPPDENYHYHVSLFFSETFFIPENTSETLRYGEITRMPFLYFWINARIINWNFLEVSILTLLRVVGIVYSVGTLIFTFLISKEFIKSKWLRILPTFLFVNTLMFVFMSGSISYDNLLNLFAVGSIYFLVRTLNSSDEREKWLLWWGIFALLGLLTKNSMMPLFFIEIVVLGYYIIKSKLIDYRKLLSLKKFLFPKVVFLLLFLLTSAFFGYNLFNYRSFIPSCDKILTVEQCMRNGVYARNSGLDRVDLFSSEGLIFVIKERLSPYEYFTRWLLSMSGRIYGIMGHRSLTMPSWFSEAYILFFFLILGVIIRELKKKEGNILALLFIFFSYAGVLLGFNYRRYLMTGLYDLALQGRYLFPVIPILYVICIFFIGKIRNKTLRRLLIFIMIIIFLLGCLPYFLIKYPVSWFL
jgi:hypothetical protein